MARCKVSIANTLNSPNSNSNTNSNSNYTACSAKSDSSGLASIILYRFPSLFLLSTSGAHNSAVSSVLGFVELFYRTHTRLLNELKTNRKLATGESVFRGTFERKRVPKCGALQKMNEKEIRTFCCFFLCRQHTNTERESGPRDLRSRKCLVCALNIGRRHIDRESTAVAAHSQ